MLSRLLALVSALIATAGLSMAEIYVVTTNADSGPGSLRQGILDANSGACARPCQISFGFRVRPPADTEPQLTIHLASPLPTITANFLTISPLATPGYLGPPLIELRATGPGTSDGLRIEGAERVQIAGLVIRGFAENGIFIDRSRLVEVNSSHIFDNAANGVVILDSSEIEIRNSTIGVNTANGIFAARSSRLSIDNNGIGIGSGLDLEKPLPNGGNGVHLHDVRRSGIASRIFHNGYTGILVTGDSSENGFSFSEFGANALLAIDLGADGPSSNDTLDADEGPNHTQNMPVIESATFNQGWVRIKGSLHSTPLTRFRVAVWVTSAPDPSGFGEGSERTFPESLRTIELMTDAEGNASFTDYFEDDRPQGPLRGRYVTAMATSFGGDSSEFSRTVPVVDDEVRYLVTTTADSGPGSLREAIEQTNSAEECNVFYPCVIAFQIQEAPTENGVFTIRPTSPLPALTHSAIWLDGDTQREFAGNTNRDGPEIEINGASCGECNGLEIRAIDQPIDQVLIRELTINGFSGHGLLVRGENAQNVVEVSGVDGCFIGTDPTGTRAVSNGRSGVHVENASFFGLGFVFLDRRVKARLPAGCIISGNLEHGVSSANASINVAGNRIGTQRNRVLPLANGHDGVRSGAASRIEFNIIAFNKGNGVVIEQPGAVNGIFNNQIHSNGLLGIDLLPEGTTANDPNDADEIQNAPVIESAHAVGNQTRIRLSLDAPQLTSDIPGYFVEIYASFFADGSGRGEGRRWLANASVKGGSPSTSFEVTVNEHLAGRFITATATRFDFFRFFAVTSTSEFSAAVQATSSGCAPGRPMLEAPAPVVETRGAVLFRWSAVSGAHLYRIWFMKPGDLPRIAHEGPATDAVLSPAPGEYEWWVEALLDDCYGPQTEHRRLSLRE